MNIQKLIDQTRDIYDDHEHTTTVMNPLDYLEQLVKKEDEQRIKKAVYNATHSETEMREPYMSGYRAGWNDALREIGIVAGPQIITALVNIANTLVKK